MRVLAVGVLVLGACGGHGDATRDGSTGDGSQTIDASSIDAAPTADAWQWQTLISNDWTTNGVAAGEGGISCVSMPVTTEIWVDGLRSSAMSEVNDHQFLILTTNPSCSATNPSLNIARALLPSDELLYGAGLGPNELDLPAGTAVHISPALDGNQQYLVLYDHIVNTGANPPDTGTSSVDVHIVTDSSSVQHDVDLMLAGQSNLDIPANDQPTTASGICGPVITAGYSWNIVALWPHMHESGTHATLAIEGTSTPVLDTAYSYTNEHPYMVDAVIDPQQTLTATCTLTNAGAKALTYQEFNPETYGNTVCWIGVYKWPTGNDPSTPTGQPYGPETCVVGHAATH